MTVGRILRNAAVTAGEDKHGIFVATLFLNEVRGTGRLLLWP